MRYQVRLHPTIDVLVSSIGEVFVDSPHSKPHWTFGCKERDGYLSVMINGKHYRVHRLVAEAFLGDIPSGYEPDHIDRNRHNNAVANLRIISRQDNNRNTSKNDRIDVRGGTHWYENEKQYMKEWYSRRHRTHRQVRFSDGRKLYIPNSEAILLLDIPVKDRHYGK